MEKSKSTVKNAFKENERITFVHIEGFSNPDLETENTIIVDRTRAHVMVNEKYKLQCKFNDFAEYRLLKLYWANIRETEDEDFKQILFAKIDEIKAIMGLY